MQYSTGFEFTAEETMERPDNVWCKNFFENERSEDNDKTESALCTVQSENA